MTGQGEAGQHKAVQASWHRFYLLTSRFLASKWARRLQKIATLQKRWSHSMTVVNRYYFQCHLYFVHWCTTAFTVENLTGETRHWGCGLRTRSSAQFCKWGQQQLLLAFLCMVSSKHQQTNHQIDQATSSDSLCIIRDIVCPGLPALEAAASLHGLGFPILPRQLHTRRMLQVIKQNDNSKVDCKSRWKPNRTNKISAGRRCCSIDSWIVLFSFLFRSGPHMLISKTGYAKKLTPWVVGFVFILIILYFLPVIVALMHLNLTNLTLRRER